MRLFKKRNIFSDHNSLLESCSKGHPKAQEQLYKDYYGYVMSIALRYAPNEEQARDILNDSFIKIFDYLAAHKKVERFKPLLRRTVINTAIDYFRRKPKFTQVELEEIPAELHITQLNDLEAADILKLLNDLPDMYRVIFCLYEIEGYSHHEISQQLGVAESTCRSNLSRAKQLLRNMIKKQELHETF